MVRSETDGEAPERSRWPASLTVATASPGGTYAIYGEGIARIIRDVVGISAAAENTQGPAQNLALRYYRSIGIMVPDALIPPKLRSR